MLLAGFLIGLRQLWIACFLRGGGFEGGTELVVWVKGSMGPAPCDDATDYGEAVVHAEFRNEAGEAMVQGVHVLQDLGQAFRVVVGGERLPVAANFGCVGLSAREPGPWGLDRQLWVMPLVSGEGRYSVGLSTVPVKDFCG